MKYGVWIDEKMEARRRWLCECGNLRPDYMYVCGSCDRDQPPFDSPTALALCDAVEALEKDRERMAEALQPFAHFWRQWSRQPMNNMADEFYAIHTGSQWEASLSRSDCERASNVLSAITHTASARAQEASTPTPAAPSDA